MICIKYQLIEAVRVVAQLTVRVYKLTFVHNHFHHFGCNIQWSSMRAMLKVNIQIARLKKICLEIGSETSEGLF